jgi:hypothetical protein
MSEITYGQRAVGLTFNPSGDPGVHRVKELYAEIIDLCSELRDNARIRGIEGSETARLFSVAITEAQTAQMWAVKALTWREVDEHAGPPPPRAAG